MSEAKQEALDPDKWGQEMEPSEHLHTWDGFMTFTKWGIIHLVVLLILMAIFLV